MTSPPSIAQQKAELHLCPETTSSQQSKPPCPPGTEGATSTMKTQCYRPHLALVSILTQIPIKLRKRSLKIIAITQLRCIRASASDTQKRTGKSFLKEGALVRSLLAVQAAAGPFSLTPSPSTESRPLPSSCTVQWIFPPAAQSPSLISSPTTSLNN